MAPDKVIELFLVDGVKVLEFMESAELDYVQTVGCDHICKICVDVSSMIQAKLASTGYCEPC